MKGYIFYIYLKMPICCFNFSDIMHSISVFIYDIVNFFLNLYKYA